MTLEISTSRRSDGRVRLGPILKLLRLSVCVSALTLNEARAASALKAGDYLEDEFLAALRSERSPNKTFHAMMDRGIAQSIRVIQGPQGLTFVANWNWHEGGDLFTLMSNGSIREAEGWRGGGFDSPVSFHKDGDQHFRLNFKKRTTGYTFIGDAEMAIVRIALVGRYQDGQGRSFIFGPDSWLHAPGLDGHFELDNDHVFDRYDFFLLGEEKRVIAFRWEDDRITLYPTRAYPDARASWEQPDYDRPMVVLRRVGATPP